MSKELSIVIPCYNEGGIIRTVLVELIDFLEASLAGKYEILVVDDCSTDDTADKLDKFPGIQVIHHPVNRGYGSAIKTGIRQAQGKFVATFDGDGQHNPTDIVKLYNRIVGKDLVLVVGARSKIFHSKYWRMPGKWFLGWLANYLSKTRIPDLNSGLRIFKKEVIIRYLHLCSDRFSFSTTSTLILLHRQYAIDFLPIDVRERAGKSTVSMMTGYETIILILRVICLFEPLRIFIPFSVFLVIVGTVYGVYPFFILKKGLVPGALLIILAGILIFFFGLLADQISSLRKEKYE